LERGGDGWKCYTRTFQAGMRFLRVPESAGFAEDGGQ
jgi:hypothetical protein